MPSEPIPQPNDGAVNAASIGAASIDNDVKLVIWDLDDTFWDGTLAEGEIKFVEERAVLVKTLAARGIISSIASKNDYGTARAVLEREGLWDYFVFPSISFDPKGKRVSEIIRNAALRPENTVFIDDNVGNLEEARFFNNAIMLAQPKQLIPVMLSHPRFAGKPDLSLERLKQYQLLQRKFIDQQTDNVSNEEFLRASEIKIYFDFDIEANIDRVVELINRTNQLNYTKKRLTTEADIDGLRAQLNEFGMSAACISCRDRYGDYGIVGFYLLETTDRGARLIHFVFSCRTMNMGIEQFVYQYLRKPELAIPSEVAYGLDIHDAIDWIAVAGTRKETATLMGNQSKLLLVGGCELLQLASYCSAIRTEFVNTIVTEDSDDLKIRYDDPYFFITDREALKRSEPMKGLAAWSYDDAALLDRSIAEAKIIILAMRAALNHKFLRTKDDIHVRVERPNIEIYARKRAAWFKENFSIVQISVKERLALFRQAFKFVNAHSCSEAAVFVIGADTHKPGSPVGLAVSGVYNNYCREFCSNNAKFHFVDVANLLTADQVLDTQHLTPAGYRALSVHIMSVLERDAARAGRPAARASSGPATQRDEVLSA